MSDNNSLRQNVQDSLNAVIDLAKHLYHHDEYSREKTAEIKEKLQEALVQIFELEGDANIDEASKISSEQIKFDEIVSADAALKQTNKNIEYHHKKFCNGVIDSIKSAILAGETHLAIERSWSVDPSIFVDHPVMKSFEITLSALGYTENAAKFFYDLLISLCQLGDKVNEFFNDPKSQQYISSERLDDVELSLHSLLEYKER